MIPVAPMLLVFALVQDTPNVDRWINDLCHELIERREQASRELKKAGEAALPAIRKALERGVLAADADARQMLVNIERTIVESVHDAKNRQRALHLVTIEDREYSLKEVVAELERQTVYRFKINVETPVSIRLGIKDRPLREVLDSVEDKLGVTIARSENVKTGPLDINAGRSERPRRIHQPGATYDIRRGPLVVHDKVEGWVLDVALDDSADARVEGVDVLDSKGKPLPVEKCPWCSPGRVFVKDRSKEPARVRVKGSVQWKSEYELKIEAVETPQAFRVGKYEILYEFLKTRVELPAADGEPHPSLRLLVDFKRGSFPWDTGASSEHWRRAPKAHEAWCGKPHDPESGVHTSTPLTTHDWNADKKIEASEVAGVRIIFSKPFREPFSREIELPPSD